MLKDRVVLWRHLAGERRPKDVVPVNEHVQLKLPDVSAGVAAAVRAWLENSGGSRRYGLASCTVDHRRVNSCRGGCRPTATALLAFNLPGTAADSCTAAADAAADAAGCIRDA